MHARIYQGSRWKNVMIGERVLQFLCNYLRLNGISYIIAVDKSNYSHDMLKYSSAASISLN